jgi:hypothetical protein
MEIKLYEIEYGNGWNGCRSNSGKELVLAEDMKSRLEKISRIDPPTCDIFYQTVIAFLLNTVFIT